MFLCSSSSAVGLWLSRLKEEKKSNYFYTVLSLLSSSAEVGQISEKWYSKFLRTCTSTVFSFRGGTVWCHLFLPGECGTDLRPNGLPLLPALPGEARLSWGLVVSAAPLLNKPVTVWSTRPAAELQSQRVLPLHPAGQSTWTQAKNQHVVECKVVQIKANSCKKLIIWMHVPTQGGLVLLIFIWAVLFIEHRAIRVAVLPTHIPSFLVLFVFLFLFAIPWDDTNADISNQAPATSRLQLWLGDLSIVLLFFLIVFFLILLFWIVIFGSNRKLKQVWTEDLNEALFCKNLLNCSQVLQSSQFQGLDADRKGAATISLVLCGHFKKQRVRTLWPIRVWLSRAGTGEGSLDHDVQRDRSWPLRRLGGWARWIEQHRYRLRKRVGVRVLMVEVVGVYVLSRRRGWFVRGEGRRGRRGRQLKAHWDVAGLIPRVWRGIDVLAGSWGVLRVSFGDGGGPLRRHRWRWLSWH